MSKQAFKRVRRALKLKVERTPLDTYAWPGGYVIVYLCADGEVICPECVNANIALVDDAQRHSDSIERVDWHVVAQMGYEEGPPLFCAHCNKEIESDYGDPDAEAEAAEAEAEADNRTIGERQYDEDRGINHLG